MSTRIEDLLLAVKNGNIGFLKRILTPENVNFVDTERRMTLLMWAVDLRQYSIVETLLDHGASIYPRDMFQFNVFHHAAWCADAEMLRILLFSSSPSRCTYARSVRSSSVRFRPGSKALVDLPHPCTGRTPLMLAAMRGDTGIVDFLITKGGSDVRLTDFRGCTALDLAAICGHKAVITLLLSKGDDDADLVFDKTRRHAEVNCEKATTIPQLMIQKDLNKLLCSDWLPQSLVDLS